MLRFEVWNVSVHYHWLSSVVISTKPTLHFRKASPSLFVRCYFKIVKVVGRLLPFLSIALKSFSIRLIYFLSDPFHFLKSVTQHIIELVWRCYWIMWPQICLLLPLSSLCLFWLKIRFLLSSAIERGPSLCCCSVPTRISLGKYCHHHFRWWHCW